MCRRAFVVALGVILAPLGAAEAQILIGTAAQITGDYSWLGEQVESGAEMAVADLNAAGGVLGEPVRLILVDDYCRGDQAVADGGAAQHLRVVRKSAAGHLDPGLVRSVFGADSHVDKRQKIDRWGSANLDPLSHVGVGCSNE